MADEITSGGAPAGAPAGGTESVAAPALVPASETPSILGGEPAAADGQGAKPAETEKPAGEDSKPSAFDAEKFQAPEGLELSETDKTFIGDMAKKHGLTNEAMTDLVGEYANRLKAVNEAATAAYVRTNEEWQAQIKSDKDIGGDKLPGVLQTISKVMDNDKITDPGFKAALNLTGAGNHPAILKTFYNMSKLLSEGGHVAGEPAAGGKPQSTGAKALYPDLPSGA